MDGFWKKVSPFKYMDTYFRYLYMLNFKGWNIYEYMYFYIQKDAKKPLPKVGIAKKK